MNILQKEACRCLCKLINLLLIKRNKEFCVAPGKVHLVFVVHGDRAFGTSACQNNNAKYWDE